MALTPYDPFRMEPLWNEINQIFRTGRGAEDLSKYLYRVDVEETQDKVYVTAEIPGIEKREDLHIVVDEDVLTIQGEVKRFSTSEGRTSHHSERYYGKFSRTINLPAVVKSDGAHAKYKNGVLEIEFLKDRRPAARTIEVDFN